MATKAVIETLQWIHPVKYAHQISFPIKYIYKEKNSCSDSDMYLCASWCEYDRVDCESGYT